MLTDHFLDSAIIIGSKIYWDRYYDYSTKYMIIDNIKRHTSKRVYDESRGVFAKNRGLISKYLEEFGKEYINKKRKLDLTKMYDSIDRFTGKFFVQNRLGEKEKKTIRNFKERNFDEFKNIILYISEIEELKRKVRTSLNDAIDFIDNECYSDENAKIYLYSDCPSNYKSTECQMLRKIINYEPDVLILLDSYHIKIHHIENDVFFITSDHEHILDNKVEIEKIISGIFLADVENEKFDI